MIQITWEGNYQAYGKFVGVDVTSSLKNKQKLENNPHASKAAGWYWAERAELNSDADQNDFIYITYAVNGGFNGYNDRLEWVENGFEELYQKCTNKDEEVKEAEYEFSDSKAYDIQKASFCWGLWHDPDLDKGIGCTKSKEKAIKGYERFIELNDDSGKYVPSRGWYGYKPDKIRNTAQNRVEELKNRVCK